jgi:hypothetical protein
LVKRECSKHTYEAYKTIIKVEIKVLQLWFKFYKALKQKVVQKIEHLVEAFNLTT